MSYKVTQTTISGLLILEPTVYGDERGFFMESFNQKDFNKAVGETINFVQDNHSRSSRGVLRGLHYQVRQPQGKLVRVSSGAVFDVAVDMRNNSKTYGSTFSVELSEYNKKMFWIPAGFAHGFMVLSEQADFLYKTTEYYDPQSEKTIIWNDAELKIDWPFTNNLKISEKDKRGEPFRNVKKKENTNDSN